jgi:hypothetical protein
MGYMCEEYLFAHLDAQELPQRTILPTMTRATANYFLRGHTLFLERDIPTLAYSGKRFIYTPFVLALHRKREERS